MKPHDSKRAVYVISVAAELAGLHAQTLRIYERKGLVDPARTPGGSRRYSDLDIEMLQRVAELTNEGMNLVGVKRVLALEAKVARLEQQLQTAEQAVGEAVAATRREYRRDLVPLNQDLLPWATRFGQ